MKTTRTLLLISIILLTLLLFSTCKEKDCNIDYEDPIGTFNDSIANQKEELYKLHAFNQINEILANNNTPVQYNREVWFDLENLENYIHYVKTKSEELEYENLGLRIYLGAVEEDGIIKTTMFFSPTNREAIRAPVGNNRNSTGVNNLNYGTSGEPADEFEG